jgi:hypothetical protein
MVRNSLTVFDTGVGDLIFSMYLKGYRGWCLYEENPDSYRREPNIIARMNSEVELGPKTMVLWGEE